MNETRPPLVAIRQSRHFLTEWLWAALKDLRVRVVPALLMLPFSANPLPPLHLQSSITCEQFAVLFRRDLCPCTWHTPYPPLQCTCCLPPLGKCQRSGAWNPRSDVFREEKRSGCRDPSGVCASFEFALCCYVGHVSMTWIIILFSLCPPRSKALKILHVYLPQHGSRPPPESSFPHSSTGG